MQKFQNIFLVGLGGFIGSVLRYLLFVGIHHLSKAGPFPISTLVVNTTGCLIIGFLGGWAENLGTFNPQIRLFLFIGLLGGFTTFSTFSYETITLLRHKEILLALINVSLHLLLGFGAVILGFTCSKLWTG